MVVEDNVLANEEGKKDNIVLFPMYAAIFGP